ncbi:hypothetical protein K438DRAFT_1947519 [Mycena galopus ATCC 62051]|nr:hypothetical protein K438DRAFT_1947519 [Mycena galopus ATCC 62051]
MVVTTTRPPPMHSRRCLCRWVVHDRSMKKGGWLKLKLEVRELKLLSVEGIHSENFTPIKPGLQRHMVGIKLARVILSMRYVVATGGMIHTAKLGDTVQNGCKAESLLEHIIVLRVMKSDCHTHGHGELLLEPATQLLVCAQNRVRLDRVWESTCVKQLLKLGECVTGPFMHGGHIMKHHGVPGVTGPEGRGGTPLRKAQYRPYGSPNVRRIFLDHEGCCSHVWLDLNDEVPVAGPADTGKKARTRNGAINGDEDGVWGKPADLSGRSRWVEVEPYNNDVVPQRGWTVRPKHRPKQPEHMTRGSLSLCLGQRRRGDMVGSGIGRGYNGSDRARDTAVDSPAELQCMVRKTDIAYVMYKC